MFASIPIRGCSTQALALAFVLSWPCTAASADNVAQRALVDQTAGRALLVRDALGRVVHLRTAESALPVSARLDSDARARTVLNQYRDAFVDVSTPLDLVTVNVSAVDAAGHSVVRYRQRVNGIPVRGGDVIVHLNRRGVTAVHSKLVSDISATDTTFLIGAKAATATAAREVGKSYPLAQLVLTPPRLEFVNPEQLRGKSGGRATLAWFTEARARGVREFVWVDAASGAVVLRFSQVAHAFAVSDYADSCLDPAPVNPPYYDEMTPAPAGSEAEAALTNLTAVYSYFNSAHGRSGFDGTNTVTQSAIVRVCASEPELAATPEKAEWLLDQMILSTGVAPAEDVVGHEYTHGIIDYTSQLNLVGQSGALAEGFADVFGEVIDQVGRTTNDSGDTRWAFGEDASGGPFRNLITPGDNSRPGKVTDSNFYCGTNTSIAIHRNGAVVANAFALLVDGGSYNGATVTGIGIAKAARIFFDTMTTRLTESSTFADAYVGFIAAADALVLANTITSGDRTQLVNALDAVELNATPCSTTLNYCPTDQSAATLFSDGFESTASGNWTNTVATGMNHWSDAGSDNVAVGTPPIYFATDLSTGTNPSGAIDPIGILPRRGTYALWGATQRRNTVAQRFGDSSVEMTNAIVIPASGDVRMQFEGRFAFEDASIYVSPDGTEITYGADGGVIEYSLNGGAWQDAGSLISAGQGYNGVVDTGQSNPLAARAAFVGSSPNTGYTSTQLDLSGSALAGQSIRFRFRIGTDNWDDNMGWQIDDVNIYTCSQTAATEQQSTKKSSGGGVLDLVWSGGLVALWFAATGLRRRRARPTEISPRRFSARSSSR